jgi:hypothetical protein
MGFSFLRKFFLQILQTVFKNGSIFQNEILIEIKTE